MRREVISHLRLDVPPREVLPREAQLVPHGLGTPGRVVPGHRLSHSHISRSLITVVNRADYIKAESKPAGAYWPGGSK